MGLFPNDTVYPPKVGESKTVTIKDVFKNDSDPHSEDNFKSPNKNHGYHYVFELADGKKMKIGTWKLYFALQEADANLGDTILIEHPDKGVYNVSRATNPEGLAKVSEVVEQATPQKTLMESVDWSD